MSYASHCAHVDPILEALRAGLADLSPQPAKIPFFSSVTGEVLAGNMGSADRMSYTVIGTSVMIPPSLEVLPAWTVSR